MAASAHAQSPPRIWDVPFGTNVRDLSPVDFVEPACGGNGGPAGEPIGTFARFEQCRAEPSGLRELAFIYDDTMEYAAMAMRDPILVTRYAATAVLGHPVQLSFLVDPQGRIAGYRIFTDPRADEAKRYEAYTLSATFRALYGLDWTCTDLPRAEGETPLDGFFVKQRCEKDLDGRFATVEARFYYRPGQQLIDPANGRPMINAFESRASIEVRQVAPLAAAAAPAAPLVAAAPADFPDQRAAFLAGATVHCPGCNLYEADLRRRDLTGADLSGANLEGAVLHRATLRRANLAGANLTEANLNRADLTQADLHGATMVNAMLWQADGARADFSGANLHRALMGKARLTLANFSGATVTLADLGEARLNDANLARADLTESFLWQSVLFRADLSGATVDRAVMVEAGLRDANLAGATLRTADLMAADLGGADLTRTDFSGARLLQAILADAKRTGTIFTGALMPDNTFAP